MSNTYYKFSGFGNFSESFGWDNGLSVNLDETPLTINQVLDSLDLEDNSGDRDINSDLQRCKQISHTINEHGGSRNVRGFIKADSTGEAETELQIWAEETFLVIGHKDEVEGANLEDFVVEVPMFIVANVNTGQEIVCNEYTVRNLMLQKALGKAPGTFVVRGVCDDTEEYYKMSTPSLMREDGILMDDVYKFNLTVEMSFKMLRANNPRSK